MLTIPAMRFIEQLTHFCIRCPVLYYFLQISFVGPSMRLVWEITLLFTRIYFSMQFSMHMEQYNLTDAINHQLDMSTASRRLKSPQSLYGASTHPTMVTHTLQSWSCMIDSHPFSVLCQSASNKAISNFDLETTRSWTWVWSKGKTIQSAQYRIYLLSFCFTSIW